MPHNAPKPLPDLAILNARYVYDPNTGLFTHKTSKGGVKIGSQAGGKCPDGYITLAINNSYYKAHRVAWYMHYKTEIPSDKELDHINGVRTDNRICNLRLVTRSQNIQNLKKARSDSGTKIIGVYYRKSTGMYHARITVKGKQKHLGVFHSAEIASRVYLDAKRKLHTHGTL